MYVCKNSGARWSLRNDGKKAARSQRRRICTPSHPSCMLRVLGGQALCKLTAFMWHTCRHHTCPGATLSSLGPSWISPLCTMFSRSYSSLQSLSSPSPHLFQLNLNPVVSTPFLYLNALQISTSSSQQVTGITPLSVPPLVWAVSKIPYALSPYRHCRHCTSQGLALLE